MPCFYQDTPKEQIFNLHEEFFFVFNLICLQISSVILFDSFYQHFYFILELLCTTFQVLS
jgi:hypothetical protein